jgi:hypothetical protein
VSRTTGLHSDSHFVIGAASDEYHMGENANQFYWFDISPFGSDGIAYSNTLWASALARWGYSDLVTVNPRINTLHVEIAALLFPTGGGDVWGWSDGAETWQMLIA